MKVEGNYYKEGYRDKATSILDLAFCSLYALLHYHVVKRPGAISDIL